MDIVLRMRSLAFAMQDAPVGEYIEWVISNTQRFEGKVLAVHGSTDEERAASLLHELVAAGLAEPC
jgi:hypothetical protein